MTSWTEAGATGGRVARKESVPTVVFIGRLSANKRPDHAIRAFGLVRQELPGAQMWVIGAGPEEARLRRLAGPGVAFLGRVSEEEKRERLARAHALVVTSVREGWGLVVTEAAAVGTVAIGYDVPGLRDSIRASGGVLTRPAPAALADGLADLLSSVAAGTGPRAEPAGVVSWGEVAARILTMARASTTGIRIPRQATPTDARRNPAETLMRTSSQLHALRAGIAILGITLLLLGGSMRGLVLSQILIGVAYLALVTAVLVGGLEGWPTRGVHLSQQRAPLPRTLRGRATWHPRLGLGVVTLIAASAVQTWFAPGRLLAGGDMSPAVGTAWLGRIFAAWSWSGSNLGGPADNESALPWAAVYWVVHMLHGSPALAERIWYTALFAGAAATCYLLLRSLGLGSAGSILGALAYIFDAHVVTVGTNPVFLAAMVLLAGIPAVILNTASGRWSLRRGIILMASSAPLLGYVSQNPPLVLMLAAVTVATPLMTAWLDGRLATGRAIRVIGVGGLLLACASAYWLVPAVLQLRIDATSALANSSSWIWTEGRANLANAFWLNNDWGWRFREYYPYAGTYNQLPLAVMKFTLPALAFGFLVVARFPRTNSQDSRKARLGIAAAVTALFLILLSTGTLLPGALIFDPLYHLPLGWLLREPGRFLMLAGLAYSVLMGLSTDAGWKKINSLAPAAEQTWRTSLRQSTTRLVAVGVVGIATLSPGFPLVTGAIAPQHRPVLPSTRVHVPAYWAAMASYINYHAPAGNVLILPEDDFYQMPYTWGYYGADTFISNLISRNVVDPVGQGYRPAQPELRAAVNLIQESLIAHDWSSAQRILAAIGTPLLLVRGDINAKFPNRKITPPAALEKALHSDPGAQLLRSFGRLELFKIHRSLNATGVVGRYATVNSINPDLRDLALFPVETALISSPARASVPAVLQVPPVAHWKLVGRRLQTSVAKPPGRRYEIDLLSSTGVYRRAYLTVGNSRRLRSGSTRRHRRHVSRRRGITAGPAPLLEATGINSNAQTIKLSYGLGASVIRNGDFSSGLWGEVGNCAAISGTVSKAELSANVSMGQGPGGMPILALSASADSACEMNRLAWKSGSLFVSLWIRHVAGAPPRICLWQIPVNICAGIAPIPASIATSRHWYHYQAIVEPSHGTRKISLYLYADTFTPGVVTYNEYSDVVVRHAAVLLQPVVLAMPRGNREPKDSLYAAAASYSAEWTGPHGVLHVEVDGLRNGWLGMHANSESFRLNKSSWYMLSRYTSMLAAALLFALLLSLHYENIVTGSSRKNKGRQP